MTRPDRAPSTCAEPGCDAETYAVRCSKHTRRASPQLSRVSASRRGYGRAWAAGPRAQTLARDPVCTACWNAPSTVADHHPHERADLVAAGIENPDDPDLWLRGVCAKCHNAKSARNRRR